MAAQHTGIYIAVPDDIAPQILNEGYRCTLRRRVPAHRNRDQALTAYRRNQRSRPPCLLEIVHHAGIATTPHKDGIKLEIAHLPAQNLTRVDRGHSASTRAPTPMYQPPLRSVSHQPPMPAGFAGFAPSMAGGLTDRQQRLQRRDNVVRLYHATSIGNATSILRQMCFHAGTRGFLGPGIYFSRERASALRYCQCRVRPHVTILVEVNLGRIKTVPRGAHGPGSRTWTGRDLLCDGCDSFEENGRDCIMLPDDTDRQIDMSTAHLAH